jgi:3-oxoacyl-[acyl-carrier-protein] synthase-3
MQEKRVPCILVTLREESKNNMPLTDFNHISIKGIAVDVPSTQESNKDSVLFDHEDEYRKFVDATGIESRYVVGDSGICTSDLCFGAAERLLSSLNWDNDSIDCLIFVSQTPDYQLPATACILQDRLKLSKDCFAMDISLGCSGWVYGLSTASAFLESGNFKRALVLAGDTTSMTKSPNDRSTFPLFGDAGTATALEYSKDHSNIFFEFGTDGSGYESIMIKDGGYRYPVNQDSLKVEVKADGKTRNDLQSILNGADVFTFGISRAPKSIKRLLDKTSLTAEDVDFLVLHQANKMMNDKIRKKAKFTEEQTLTSLAKYGNTSSASIPLTICAEKHKLKDQNQFLVCGFGVGLSWGSALFQTTSETKFLDIKHV